MLIKIIFLIIIIITIYVIKTNYYIPESKISNFIYKIFKIKYKTNNLNILELKYNLLNNEFYFDTQNNGIDEITLMLCKHNKIIFLYKNLIFDLDINNNLELINTKQNNVLFNIEKYNKNYYLVVNNYLFLNNECKFNNNKNENIFIEFLNSDEKFEKNTNFLKNIVTKITNNKNNDHSNIIE